MKQVYLLLFIGSAVFTGCGSDDPKPESNNQEFYSTGFICTKGINGIGDADTIVLRAGTSGSFTITSYTHTAEDGGFLERPKDIWVLETAGDNSWRLKNNAGKYVEFSEDFADPINENPNKYGYQYDLEETPTEDGLFLRNQDGNEFYLEPKAKPGFYLVTRPGNVQPPDPRHSRVIFLPTKQMWFFMP